MARLIHRLRQAEIAKLGPGMHADGGGLYLVVKGEAGRSWIFRYRREGRLRDRGLGPTKTISLAKARREALAYRSEIYHGREIEVRKRRQAKTGKPGVLTFAQAAEQYITAYREGWKGIAGERQWRQQLNDYVFPVFGDRSVSEITTELVMEVLRPLWASKTKMANRLRGRIEQVLDWAATMQYRQGDNPARWRGHLKNLLPRPSRVAPIEHFEALPYSEVAGFIERLRQQGSVATKALEFLILTAARTGEVQGAVWEEIDLQDRQWVIPAARMKAGKPHRVPLSEAAIAILEEMKRARINNFVFPGASRGRPLGPAVFNQVLTRIGRRNGETVHGFRSAFRDWVAEQTTYPRELAEMSLAHDVGNEVEQAYRRSDLLAKRRQLMEEWGRQCRPPGLFHPVRG